MLEVQDLHVSYGAIKAVKGVSLSVKAGEIVALIGGNGAGKSTILRAISSILRTSSGKVFLEGRDITSTSPEKIVESGLIHVPEGRQIFGKMTVDENLKLGAYLLRDPSTEKLRREKVFSLFPILKQRHSQTAGTLSGGEQQMLAIGRGIMAGPKILLLDEPSLGLSPIITQTVFDVIAGLKNDGITLLIVEQNAYEALEISDRAYILETGRIVMEGESKLLEENPVIKKAYLGED